MLRSLIQETRQSAAKQERPNYMPRSLNHESEQEPSKWVYTPSSMSYEGKNRAKREAPSRTGQKHATRDRNKDYQRIKLTLWFTVLLIIAMILKGPLKSSLEDIIWSSLLYSKHFEHIFDFLTTFLRSGGQI